MHLATSVDLWWVEKKGRNLLLQGKAFFYIIVERGGILHIEMIDRRCLKIELDYSDMEMLDIKRTSFSRRDEKASRVLKTLLKTAYEQTGFDIFDSKMLVEIFPTADSGCLIMFTREGGRRFKAAVIKRRWTYRFCDVNNLLDCINMISDKNVLKGCSIYRYNGMFYLCFSENKHPDKSTRLTFSEFNGTRDNISQAILIEHGSAVCEQFAM